ncbi:hypothetical protein [Streptomyces sp. V3I7]|uniref:hypothetical protein n=1 Tax=Streptomyces sp. V3I7 TaxID=3042278 RepID=UPI002789F182|nr:hypothetical protein [Streptomyces sp. V3I7]MDQ0993659.1 hypothetical protein [Streptomyces sp. V3I7]
MFRGTTPRAVLARLVPLLATTLLALLIPQLFASAGSFASAHTLRQAEAKAQPGILPPVNAPEVSREGAEEFRGTDHSGDPSGPPQARERRRTTTAGWEHAPLIPGRGAALTRPPDAHGARHHRTAQAPRPASPAALQVFRC